MASTFSINHTATAGFRLIGKRPVSFVVWTLVWLVLGMGPLALTMVTLMPKMFEFMRGADGLGSDPSHALSRVLAFEATIWGTLGPWALWGFLVQLVLLSATYRAMLEPQKRAFAYLRVGMDELRLLATEVLLVLLFVLLSIVLGIVIALFFWAGAAVSSPWTGWIGALGVILALCVMFYVGIKVSLALPATFAEKQIRVFEALRLGRGRFWSLVGMWLLSLVFIFALSIVTGIIARVAAFGVMMGAGGPQAIANAFSNVKSGADMANALSHMLGLLGPALIGWLLFHGIVQALVRVIATAPFASAYAAFTDRSDAI